MVSQVLLIELRLQQQLFQLQLEAVEQLVLIRVNLLKELLVLIQVFQQSHLLVVAEEEWVQTALKELV